MFIELHARWSPLRWPDGDPSCNPSLRQLPAGLHAPQPAPAQAKRCVHRGVMPSIDQCATTANRSAPTMDSHEKEQPVPIWPSGLPLRL